MPVRRRQVLAAVGSGIGGTVVGSARAASPTVTGQVVSKADVGLAGSRIEFEFGRVELAANGTFESQIDELGPHQIIYFDSPSGEWLHTDPNQRPVIYDFGEVSIESGTNDIGTLELPAAETVQIRCVTPDGAPIENLPFNLRAPSGSGLVPGAFGTEADGYVKHPGADHTGVEIAPPVDMEVQPPSRSGDLTSLGQIDTIDDGHRTIEIPRADRFPGVDVQGANAATDDRGPAPPTEASGDSLLDGPPISTITVLTAAGVVFSAGSLFRRILDDD